MILIAAIYPIADAFHDVVLLRVPGYERKEQSRRARSAHFLLGMRLLGAPVLPEAQRTERTETR